MEPEGSEAILPEELITEILLKLPVKSLLKFRSVSKPWLSLISSPVFAKAHLLVSASNKDCTHHRVMFSVDNRSHDVMDCSLSSLVYGSVVTEVLDLDYPGKSPDDYPRIVGSFNGLICFAVALYDGLYDLFLWNPSIRKYNKLPDYRLNLRSRYHKNERVDFKFGFAYDESQDDYKVVGIFPIYMNGNLSRVEVRIYSLKGNSWRRVDDFQGAKLVDEPGKLVNGKLHWLDSGWNIVSIDLADEKWFHVEQPSYFQECDSLALGVFGSDLSAICSNRWDNSNVWVMKEYGIKESWMKMFTIKSPDDHIGFIFNPLILMLNEGEILLRCGSHLAIYNPKDDSTRYLRLPNFSPCLEAEIYVKSLVCPF